MINKSGAGALMVNGLSLNEVTTTLCQAFTDKGACNETERRGSKVREFWGPALIEIRDPTANILLLNGRNNDPWVSMCELPWLLAGRNDIAWLLPYLPRAADFSDNGRTWRAGYGPRLRNWDGGHPGTSFDQLQRVVDLLEQNPDTRQAVISLWDPLADLAPHYHVDGNMHDRDLNHRWTQPGDKDTRFKDYPCTNWLHFQVVDNALDLTVVMRSNDLFWGFSGVNVFNFTMLQQLVAASLGVEEGTYRHMASNLHVYERHFEAVERVAKNSEHEDPYNYFSDGPAFLGGSGPHYLHEITGDCKVALSYVENWRSYGEPRPWRAVAGALAGVDPWLVEWSYFMLLHSIKGVGGHRYKVNGVLELLEPIGGKAMLAAAALALGRTYQRMESWNAAVMKHFANEVGSMSHPAVGELITRELGMA